MFTHLNNKYIHKILLFSYFLPGFFLEFLKFGSYAPGTLLVIFFIFIYQKIKYGIKLDKLLKIMIAILIVHSLLAVIFLSSWSNFYRILYSMSAAIVMLITAKNFILTINDVNEKLLDKYISWLVYIHIIYIALTLVYLISGGQFKIFFAEMSHFAISIAPLITYFTYKHSLKNNYKLVVGIILFLLLIQLINKNMTMLVLTLFILILVGSFRVFIILIIFLVIYALFNKGIDLSYYTSRLFFNQNTNNMSTLVLLSGWERAALNFINTNGLGVGVNLLGIEGDKGAIQEAILLRSGHYKNLNDGGSIASKLIAEFGIIGIILNVFYIISWFIIFYNIKCKKNKNNTKLIFFKIVFLSYFIELYVRGLSYFTLTTFIFLCSIFYILNNQLENKK